MTAFGSCLKSSYDISMDYFVRLSDNNVGYFVDLPDGMPTEAGERAQQGCREKAGVQGAIDAYLDANKLSDSELRSQDQKLRSCLKRFGYSLPPTIKDVARAVKAKHYDECTVGNYQRFIGKCWRELGYEPPFEDIVLADQVACEEAYVP